MSTETQNIETLIEGVKTPSAETIVPQSTQSIDAGSAEAIKSAEQQTTFSKETAYAEMLKEQGLTAEDIAELKKVKEEKSKPPKEEMAFAELVNYGIKSNKLSKDEVLKFESISKVDDNSLVYEKFKAEQLENDDTLTEDEIKEAFEDEYNLNSSNEKIVALGKSLIEKEASEIRKPITDKVHGIKSEFVAMTNMGDYRKQQETIISEFNNHPIVKDVIVNGEKIQVEVKPNISFDDLKNHFTNTEEGKVQNDWLFSAFVEDRNASEKILGQLLGEMAGKKQDVLQAVADAVWQKADDRFKSLAIGAKSPFTAPPKNITEATKTVDSRQQYKNYLDSL